MTPGRAISHGRHSGPVDSSKCHLSNSTWRPPPTSKPAAGRRGTYQFVPPFHRAVDGTPAGETGTVPAQQDGSFVLTRVPFEVGSVATRPSQIGYLAMYAQHQRVCVCTWIPVDFSRLLYIAYLDFRIAVVVVVVEHLSAAWSEGPGGLGRSPLAALN